MCFTEWLTQLVDANSRQRQYEIRAIRVLEDTTYCPVFLLRIYGLSIVERCYKKVKSRKKIRNIRIFEL